MNVVVTTTNDSSLAALVTRIQGTASAGTVTSSLQNYNPQVDWNNLQAGMILFVGSIAGLSSVTNMLGPTEGSFQQVVVAGLYQLGVQIYGDLNSVILARTSALNILNVPANLNAAQNAVGAGSVGSLVQALEGYTAANSLTLENFGPSTTSQPYPSPLVTAVQDLQAWTKT
jgi:hypothetical protein